MSIEYLGDHILITLLGWLIGVLFGTALGYALGVISLRLYPPDHKPALLFLLIPWRTLVAGLLLINLLPLIPTHFLGLGNEAGIVSVAFVLFLISAILTVQTIRTSPTAPALLHSISWIRSLAVLSVLLTTHYGTWGGGGFGWDIVQYLNLLNYERAIVAGGWIVGIALAFDLIIGSLGYIVSSKVAVSPS